MKININGITREATREEIAELEAVLLEMPAPQPTPEERLFALEQASMEQDAALMELAAMLAGGV